MFKLAIRGSYSVCRPGFYEGLERKLDALLANHDEATIVLDGDQGVGAHAARYARRRDNIRVRYFEPEWQRLGKLAGSVATRESINYADAIVLLYGKRTMAEVKQLPDKGDIACMAMVKYSEDTKKPIRTYFVEFDDENNAHFNLVPAKRGQFTF